MLFKSASNLKPSLKDGSFSSHTFLGTLPSLFAREVSQEVKELYLNSAILDLAVAMVLFFEPIYLYGLGISLRGIILFYLGIYLLYFFLLPLGGKFVKRSGVVASIFLGSPFLILYYLFLALSAHSLYFLIPAIFSFALQKTFYWPGYHTDFAQYGKEMEQGREVSNSTSILLLVYIFGPLLGGVIMHFFNFTVLFTVVSLLIILSNFPLLLVIPRSKREFFSYRACYRRLVERKNIRRLIAYIGFGEELIVLVLWPIFVFIVVRDTLKVGLLVAFSTLLTALVVLYVGKLTDYKRKDSVLRFITSMYVISWVIRIFVKTQLGVFAVDTFSRIGKSSLSIPLTAITYQYARKRDVVEQVIFFEMSLIVGKILAMVGILVLLSLFSGEYLWGSFFILAAVFSILYGVLKGD